MEGQIKCFPDKVKLKEFIITKPLYEILRGLIKEKGDQELWTVKWQQAHNYQQSNQSKNKNKLSKQLEWEQIHRNRDHMEGYQWEDEGGEQGKRYRE